jgi:hypothetical protein
MGTRSLIKIIDDDFGQNRHIATIYQQYDGYPDGVGVALASFIVNSEFVNGIPGGQEPKGERFVNGAGCFAAAFIAHIKHEPGGVYLYPADAEDEEYNYTVTISGPEVSLKVSEGLGGLLFEGSPEEFLTKFVTA